ncbi:MAG TPA: Clp protease N-terminal domain-containing protein [Longimicrobium sp.]
MSYNFTGRMRKVLEMARDEAICMRDSHIQTEHLLLALARAGSGQEPRPALAKRGTGGGAVALPYSKQSVEALDLAFVEALQDARRAIDTSDVIRGLVRQRERDDSSTAVSVVDRQRDNPVEETEVRGNAAAGTGRTAVREQHGPAAGANTVMHPWMFLVSHCVSAVSPHLRGIILALAVLVAAMRGDLTPLTTTVVKELTPAGETVVRSGEKKGPAPERVAPATRVPHVNEQSA